MVESRKEAVSHSAWAVMLRKSEFIDVNVSVRMYCPLSYMSFFNIPFAPEHPRFICCSFKQFFRTTHKDFADQGIKIGDARLATWFECVYLEGVSNRLPLRKTCPCDFYPVIEESKKRERN